jgi:hypothetical protein
MSPSPWGVAWSHKSSTGLINRMLSKLFPSIRDKQTSSLKRVCMHESMTKEKNPPNPYSSPEFKVSTKSPSLHLSGEPPVSGLHCTTLAAAFPFSNKAYFVCQPCCLTGQSAASRANSLACEGKNSQYQPTAFLTITWRDFSPGLRSIQLSAKPAGVCLMYDCEPLAPCWILLLRTSQ